MKNAPRSSQARRLRTCALAILVCTASLVVFVLAVRWIVHSILYTDPGFEYSCRRGSWSGLQRDAYEMAEELEAFRARHGAYPNTLEQAGVSERTPAHSCWRYSRSETKGGTAFGISAGLYRCGWTADLLVDWSWNLDRAGAIDPELMRQGERIWASLAERARERGHAPRSLTAAERLQGGAEFGPWELETWSRSANPPHALYWHGRLLPLADRAIPREGERPYLTFTLKWSASERH